MNFPAGCTSPRQQHQYCVYIEEVLKKIHNYFGKWKNDGITQTQYNNGVTVLAHILKRIKYPGQTIAQLKIAIGNKYPYVPQLSQVDWVKFKMEDWEPLSGELSSLIPEFKVQMRSIKDFDLGGIPDIQVF